MTGLFPSADPRLPKTGHVPGHIKSLRKRHITMAGKESVSLPRLSAMYQHFSFKNDAIRSVTLYNGFSQTLVEQPVGDVKLLALTLTDARVYDADSSKPPPEGAPPCPDRSFPISSVPSGSSRRPACKGSCPGPDPLPHHRR